MAPPLDPAVVRRIQSRLDLLEDGRLGPLTLTAIDLALADADEYFRHRDSVPAQTDRRQRILKFARAAVGIRELTGKNDGPRVDAILASCGLAGSGKPYCAALPRYVYDLAGLAALGPQKAAAAWSPNWVIKPTWTQAGGLLPRPGDVFGIWFKKQGRVAHCGIIIEWGKDEVVTIEGNTSAAAAIGSQADREGQGVFMRTRRKSEIHSVQNWLD